MREPSFQMDDGSCVCFSAAPDDWLTEVASGKLEYNPMKLSSDDVQTEAFGRYYAGVLLRERTNQR